MSLEDLREQTGNGSGSRTAVAMVDGTPRIDVCHMYGCDVPNRASAQLGLGDWMVIQSTAFGLRSAVKNAADERLFAAWFITVMERATALALGWHSAQGSPHTQAYPWACRSCGGFLAEVVAADAAISARFRAPPGRGWLEFEGGKVDIESDKAGGMDCIDNAMNAGTYLRLMERLGLLTYHQPTDNSFASMGHSGVLEHYAGALEETGSGQQWVIDTYFGTLGTPPLIGTMESFQNGSMYTRSIE